MLAPSQLSQCTVDKAMGLLRVTPAYASLSFQILNLCGCLQHCVSTAWWMFQASILAISLNCHGNPCRTLELATKVQILNKIKKGDVLRTNGNVVAVLFV